MATTDDTAAKMLGAVEMEEIGEDMRKSSSRFQVARVDSQSGRRGSGDDYVCVDTGSPQSGPESPGGARFSISTNSITNNTYDTSNNPCGWGNTHEALPSEDHYRNILSATAGLAGTLKARPTLAELHEEIVSSLSSATTRVH